MNDVVYRAWWDRLSAEDRAEVAGILKADRLRTLAEAQSFSLRFSPPVTLAYWVEQGRIPPVTIPETLREFIRQTAEFRAL